MLAFVNDRYNTLGLKRLMNLSTFPELEDFRRDSLDNASMLNRYIIDVSSCLVYQKVLRHLANNILTVTVFGFLLLGLCLRYEFAVILNSAEQRKEVVQVGFLQSSF